MNLLKSERFRDAAIVIIALSAIITTYLGGAMTIAELEKLQNKLQQQLRSARAIRTGVVLSYQTTEDLLKFVKEQVEERRALLHMEAPLRIPNGG